MEQYIKGQYIHCIFNSDNGYIIGLLKISETNDQELLDYIGEAITFTGYFAELNINDNYTFYGELINHPKYGLQYQVKSSEKVKPQDKDGIVLFLSSKLFTGVGTKLATRIVNTLGEKTLDLILEDKNNLLKVPKMSTKKVDLIYETLTKYEESSKIIVYLTELGFSMREALNIYNKYKDKTMQIIESNPYELLDDNLDISFLKIDQIYLTLNKPKDDLIRIKASILYIMHTLVYNNSDTYLNIDEIKIRVIKYLGFKIDDLTFNDYFQELEKSKKIVIQDNHYYLYELYHDELEIIDKIKYLKQLPQIKINNLDKYIQELEEENKIKYSKKQKEALKLVFKENILIITGGPGTGKTTLIKAIVDLYGKIYALPYKETVKDIALLAPTGRASKRMSELAFFKASTIHRYLKWDKDTNSFSINQFNPNQEKIIIVDEVSMIDTNLLASLCRGTLNNIKLVLVGDYNQLPSVGPGQVLKDLIESNYINMIELDLLYRQGRNSYISELAYQIKENKLENFKRKTDDFIFLECSRHMLTNNIISIAKQLKEKGYDYKKCQFLAPQYAGINGIDNLNKQLQNIFNPPDNELYEVKYGDIFFRENDKILQLVNMTDENIFNGDVGVIKYIIPFYESDSGKNELYIDYDGHIVRFLPSDFSKIKHGYIISIHKSQGSEFDTVVIPICYDYKRMLYKKLIYTGITRAKKRLIMIGEIDALNYSIKNNIEILRKTTLQEKLNYLHKKNKIN